MTKLPVISGEKAIKAFAKAGWYVDRVVGSHAILRKEGTPVTLSVPLHKEIKKGLLRALIRDADMTVEEFLGFFTRR